MQPIVSSYADITRPANTTTYAAADVIAESASAAEASVFTRCSATGSPSRGGVIRSVTITSSNDQTTKLNSDLFLFSAAPVTFGNDNTAFAPTDAEMLTCVAAVHLDGTAAGNSFTGLTSSGNWIGVFGGLGLAFECAENDNNLYGVLVARNAYVPISAEVFRIRLGIQQG